MILVDSDVLISHLRGVSAATAWLSEARATTGKLAISVVTLLELESGMRSAERRPVAALLSSMRIIEVDVLIARRAGAMMRSYRRSHSGIGLGDYLIAATADVADLELNTLNVRHYPMFAGLAPPFPVLTD